jgi:hypothetical protein
VECKGAQESVPTVGKAREEPVFPSERGRLFAFLELRLSGNNQKS